MDERNNTCPNCGAEMVKSMSGSNACMYCAPTTQVSKPARSGGSTFYPGRASYRLSKIFGAVALATFILILLFHNNKNLVVAMAVVFDISFALAILTLLVGFVKQKMSERRSK